MSRSHVTDVGPRLHYPASAILAVAAAWTLSAFAVAFFSLGSLILLPLLPVFFAGPLCLIGAAHDYARRVARQRVARRPRVVASTHVPHPAA